MIIGSLASIFIVVWFYFTARNSGRSPVQWAMVGFVIYIMIALLWTYFVNPPIKDAALHSNNSLLIWLSRYAYIVVAFSCAAVYNLKFGQKKE
jgi:RsiW-degrading membrane proteinase PrsW (M82 family)